MDIHESNNSVVKKLNCNSVIKICKNNFYLSEIDILKRLSSKHIMNIYGILWGKSNFNIIMELGVIDLFDMVTQNSFYVFFDSIMFDLLQGLTYIHSHNILHMDIKLENIIFKEGRFCYADFGYSIYNIRPFTKVSCGTPNYMDPLLILNRQHATFGSDIWSLGVLFYVCTSQYFPYEYKSDKIEDIEEQVKNSIKLIGNEFYMNIFSEMLLTKNRVSANYLLKKYFEDRNPIYYQYIRDDNIIIKYSNISNIFSQRDISYVTEKERWAVIAVLDLYNELMNRKVISKKDDKIKLNNYREALVSIVLNFCKINNKYFTNEKDGEIIKIILQTFNFKIYRYNIYMYLLDNNFIFNFAKLYDFLININFTGTVDELGKKFITAQSISPVV